MPERRTPLRATPARQRIRNVLVLSHRWAALVLGLLLVVVSTSGAVLVYGPELTRAANADYFHTTVSNRPVTFAAAVAAVQRVDSDFVPGDMSLKDGVYFLATDDGSGQTYFVDAGSGAINGKDNLHDGAIGFLQNLHDCGLTCEGYAGYKAWLAAPAPLASVAPFAEMTWGNVLLAVAAAVLVLLVVTAPFIWWPGIRRLGRRLRLRWRKGRYARDFDLHNLIGVVAVIPLLIWGLTGLNFEVPGVHSAWYALTGGQQPNDQFVMEPSSRPGSPVTLDQAIAVAERQFPGSHATWVAMPETDDGFYLIDVLDRSSPNLWAHNSEYEGNRSLGVDARDPGHVEVMIGRPATVSNAIADEWAQPALHYGHVVNPYWRVLWFVLGLSPLLLMLTGLSTWWYRRKVKRARVSGRLPADQSAVGTGPRAAS